MTWILDHWSTLAWIAIAAACIYQHAFALKEGLEDRATVEDPTLSTVMSLAEIKAIQKLANNMIRRYSTRLVIAVNNFLVGIALLLPPVVQRRESGPWWAAVLGQWLLFTLLANELAQLWLTVKDRRQRRA